MQKKYKSNIDQVQKRLKKLQTQKIAERLSKLKNGLSITDPWPYKKYKDKFCVEEVIKRDPAYVYWCITEANLKLDKEAEMMFMYEHENFLEEKNNIHDSLNAWGYDYEN